MSVFFFVQLTLSLWLLMICMDAYTYTCPVRVAVLVFAFIIFYIIYIRILYLFLSFLCVCICSICTQKIYVELRGSYVLTSCILGIRASIRSCLSMGPVVVLSLSLLLLSLLFCLFIHVIGKLLAIMARSFANMTWYCKSSKDFHMIFFLFSLYPLQFWRILLLLLLWAMCLMSSYAVVLST